MLLSIILVAVLAVIVAPGWIQYAAMAASALGGESARKKAHAARTARMAAINRMRKMWVKGYQKQQGQYDFAEQEIRGQGMAGMGTATAGMASSGLLNTTAGSNAMRGVAQGTQRGLMGLASKKASNEYGMWMDRAQLFGMTEWDNSTFNQGGNQQFLGALAGQAMGQQGLPDWMTTMPSWGGWGGEPGMSGQLPKAGGAPTTSNGPQQTQGV